MRLLYFIPSLNNSGGTERIITAKVNWLVENGYEITILTSEKQSGTPFFYLNPKINIINLDIDFNGDFNKSFIKKVYKHFKKKIKYKKLVKNYLAEHPQDILISLCGKELDFVSKFKNKSKVIAELHFNKNYKINFQKDNNRGFVYSILGKLLTRKMINKTKKLDKLIVLTKADKKEWETSNKNVIQIYNGLDVRKNKNFDQYNKVISVGRLTPQKGYDRLIKAWKEVKKKHSDWHLDIYGEGDLFDSLQELVEVNKLRDVVSLKGVSVNVINEMHHSSFFVMSSVFEGFPMVLLEASSQGLPIISYDCPTGPSEIIENGKNGFLVEEGNIEELAKMINEMINNKELRRKMSIEAHRKYDEFNFEKIMIQWDKLFRQLKK